MRYLLSILLICCMLSLTFADVPTIPVKEGSKYVPGELIAFIPAGREAQTTTNILETWGYAQTRREINFGGVSFCLYEAQDRGVAKSVPEAVKIFNQDMTRESNGVKLLPNYIFTICDKIKEPCFNRIDICKDKEGNPKQIMLQWDMNNPGELNGIPGADLNVMKAWEIVPQLDKPIVVAVIDTGVDTEHPAFKGRILMKDGKVVGKDFTSWWGNGSHMDDHGHGSHCAGSIASAYNDNEGMTGSSGPTNVKIMPVKALSKEGSGDLFSIAGAMKWAGEQKADIISMSLGATPLWPEQEPILKQAFDEVVAAPELKNSIIIAAAGNNGKDLHSFPAFCDRVIAIGASDHQDKLAVFSNFGNWVDVVSPGVNIVSVRPKFDGRYLDMYQDAGHKKAEFAIGNNAKTPYDQRRYFVASGTSMACPNAAGVAAMILAVNPKLKTNTEAMRSILMETSVKKGTFKIKADGGRIDAYQALLKAKSMN